MTPDPAVCPARHGRSGGETDGAPRLPRDHRHLDLAERSHGIITDRDIIRRVVAEEKSVGVSR
jgi:CBS domain-containing protein